MKNIQDTEKIKKEIEKIISKKILVIVEGKKDKNALLELGLSNILVINQDGIGLYKNIDKINEKEVAILTDFDKKGRKMYQIIKNELIKKGVKIDSKLRLLLLKSKLSHIEGIDSFLETSY